jgi:hypothetical protein
MGLLLYACGGSTTNTSTPTSLAPAGTQPMATTFSSETTLPSVTEPAETSSDTESPDSDGTDGITQEEDQLIPPIAPDPPTLETTSEGLEIRWRGTGPDIASYLVYQRPAPSELWTIVGEVSSEGDNLGSYSFVIAEVPDQIGEFAIVAVDIDGNPSQFSEAVTVND